MEGMMQGTTERTMEGTMQGMMQGTTERTMEGTMQGTTERTTERTMEGTMEGTMQGTTERTTERTMEHGGRDHETARLDGCRGCHAAGAVHGRVAWAVGLAQRDVAVETAQHRLAGGPALVCWQTQVTPPARC